jgi:Tol biopolymer transport system component
MLYFASDRDGGAMKIFRVAIDQSTGVTSGEPQVVGDAGAPMRGHLSMSDDGVLTYMDRSVNRAMFRLALGADGAPEGEPVRVSDPSVSPSGFSISPDGQWVAFVLGDNNQEDVFVMRADGSELKQLTNDPYRDRGATWSPDSRTIAFRSDRPAEGTSGTTVYEHWQIGRDGTGLRKITSIDVAAANPIFAPNGRSIAMFHPKAAGGDELLLMDPDGSNVRTVATSAQGFGAPVWSPDSRRVAFREVQGSGGRAYLLDVTRAGATPEPLPEMNFNPLEWLPDGSAIVGNRLATDRPAQAVVYDVAAQRFEELSGGGPSWLPDGRQVVTLRDGNTAIQVVDRATKAARDLVTVPPPNSVGPFNLSPDGRSLFYIQTELEADIRRMVP